MRTIKISILNFKLGDFISSTALLCAASLIICFVGCSRSRDVIYHELTAEELAESQPEIATLEDKTVATLKPDLPAKLTPTDSKPPLEPTQPPTTKPPSIPTEKKTAEQATKNIKTVSGTTPSLPVRPGMLLPGQLPEKIEKRDPKLLIPDKTFSKVGSENVIRVTFDDVDLLKVLNMEPVPQEATKMFPGWLSDLEGKRVRMRGFMFPTISQKGITYFQHVRDNEICCFGRTPKVYDRISTVLKEGESTDYIQGRPFDVVGTFRIDPIYIDGEWLQLYLLEDAIVVDDK